MKSGEKCYKSHFLLQMLSNKKSPPDCSGRDFHQLTTQTNYFFSVVASVAGVVVAAAAVSTVAAAESKAAPN